MPNQPFLALITPIGSGASQPPAPGVPTHPWVPPLGIWGGGGVGDYIDAGFPGPQPGQPPRPWGPVYYPDQGLPQPQPPMGGRPTHPIYYPPVIWDPSRPTNPIVNPGDPNQPGTGQPGSEQPKIEWKTAWSPSTGWVVVGVPTGEHVTPSSKGSQQSQSKPPEQSGQPGQPTPPKP